MLEYYSPNGLDLAKNYSILFKDPFEIKLVLLLI